MQKRYNLIRARKDAGLTQTQLGERIGLSKQQICNIEVGLTGARVAVWDKLEDLLGIPQRQLREAGLPDEAPQA